MKIRKIVTLVTISLIILVSISFLLCKTYINFNKYQVNYYDKSNTNFAFYNGEQQFKEMPEKNNLDGLIFSYGECDNGAYVEWNSEQWAPLIKNLKKSETKCSLHFGKLIELGKDILPVENGDGLYAVTHDNLEELSSEWNKTEYRFAGVNPNNYVRFNNEIWRIIGLVNVKMENGNIEQRIKIIRQDGIEGQKDFGEYSWDTKDVGIGSSDNIYGSNDWTDSQLKDMLNGIYYESSIGDCYKGNRIALQCDFTGNGNLPKGLNELAKSMIDKDATWNLGACQITTANQYYEKERETKVYSNGDITRPTEWSKTTDVGNKHNGVGLMYPSDYGYAVGGEVRNNCLTKNLDNYNDDNCSINNWLFKNTNQWLLSPYYGYPFLVNSVYSDGHVAINYGSRSVVSIVNASPVVYLKSNVQITGGTGELNSPFIVTLSLPEHLHI